MRLSFCCSVEGCRKRVTPRSLRFLGRKVFFGVWVLLLPVLRDGPTRERLRRLEEVFGVSRRTLLRWRLFWREAVPGSRFWEARRGHFAVPVAAQRLPGSLLEAFTGAADPSERVLAVLRFVAPLSALLELAERVWLHPVTGQSVRFGVSTIERWYYAAQKAADPVVILRRKPRKDSGQQQAISPELGEALRRQHAAHPSWSYQLHLDNLAALLRDKPHLGPLPSYASLRRYLVAHGLLRHRRRSVAELCAGERRALERRQQREVRSYEAEYVNGLWHLDFHHGSHKILTLRGQWVRPILLTILDDRSRLACHAQWYLNETAESLVHGISQAFLKRGLPRTLLSDNGSAMIASETTQGLRRLSILQQTTLPYSPHQNGKQEVFWAQVEGRLLAMLEGQPDLTLSLLNQATLAWVEMEYHRTVHSETEQTPLARWLEGLSVGRDCPGIDDLRLAFTAAQSRIQRTSDGTISIEGARFEIPARFRHLRQVQIRYASWDRRHVWLMDETTGTALDRLYPLDRTKNADAVRRPIKTTTPPVATTGSPAGMAPLLRQLMEQYAATGLPPAYIPQGG